MSSLAQIEELLNAALEWAVEGASGMPQRMIDAAKAVDDSSEINHLQEFAARHATGGAEVILGLEIAVGQVVENVRAYFVDANCLPNGDAPARFWAAMCLVAKRMAVVSGWSDELRLMLQVFESRLEVI